VRGTSKLGDKYGYVVIVNGEEFLDYRINFSLKTVFFWVVTQQVVVTPYRRFRTTYRSHLYSQESKKNAGESSTGFIEGRAWAVISISSVVPANGVDVGGRRDGEV